jgi:AcrR family transcriptional regulator
MGPAITPSAPSEPSRASGRGAKSGTNGKRAPSRGAKVAIVAGEPASKRALRSQGRKTMRKLLEAAMVVFARRGYHAARVDDIVKVARTSHGTFYLYFSNKEDLLRALVGEAGEVVAALDEALGPVGPDPAGWQELRTWMEHFSQAWQRYAPVLRAWTDLVMSDSELGAQGHAAAGQVARTLATRIDEAGSHSGVDPNAAAEAVVAMVDRFHQLRQFAHEPVDALALDTLTTMVHRGLFGGGPPPVRVLWADSPGPDPVLGRDDSGDGAGRS